MKLLSCKAKNCKIHPVLYHFYRRLRETLGAEMVHRRKRNSSTCIEIIFNCAELCDIRGHLHTLKEAEKWGFFVICRPQTNPKRAFYHGHRVFQMFLTPVHPHKRREMNTIITPLLSNVSTLSREADVLSE